jgi:integrator complex subunit 11
MITEADVAASSGMSDGELSDSELSAGKSEGNEGSPDGAGYGSGGRAAARELSVTPLGAGQQVGRSCHFVRLNGWRLLLDCGVHPGRDDHRRFPDFSQIPGMRGSYTAELDCVVISHFHLDHCGALPWLTERLGYRGPLVMTLPTQAVFPSLLRDYRKVCIERKGAEEEDLYSEADVGRCAARATTVALHQTLILDPQPGGPAGRGRLELTAYYAGHALGAAMFYARCGADGLLYTGDFNSVSDRHLGPAVVPRLRPSLLISECTYGNKVRAGRWVKERALLAQIRVVVEAGGKVLVPCFAVGRAQEVCALLQAYWAQASDLAGRVPILMAKGLAEEARVFFRMFLGWANAETTGRSDSQGGSNPLDFTHIQPFDRLQHWPMVLEPGRPMVLLAAPGMLSGGLALQVFKEWAVAPGNFVLMTGYCVGGTVGHALLSGQRKRVRIGGGVTVDVACQVGSLPAAAHADGPGVMGLIQQLQPAHVLLVHGDATTMAALRGRVAAELGVPCAAPPDGTTVAIELPSERTASAWKGQQKEDPSTAGGWRRRQSNTIHSVGVVGGAAVAVDEFVGGGAVGTVDESGTGVLADVAALLYRNALGAPANPARPQKRVGGPQAGRSWKRPVAEGVPTGLNLARRGAGRIAAPAEVESAYAAAARCFASAGDAAAGPALASTGAFSFEANWQTTRPAGVVAVAGALMEAIAVALRDTVGCSCTVAEVPRVQGWELQSAGGGLRVCTRGVGATAGGETGWAHVAIRVEWTESENVAAGLGQQALLLLRQKFRDPSELLVGTEPEDGVPPLLGLWADGAIFGCC